MVCILFRSATGLISYQLQWSEQNTLVHAGTACRSRDGGVPRLIEIDTEIANKWKLFSPQSAHKPVPASVWLSGTGRQLVPICRLPAKNAKQSSCGCRRGFYRTTSVRPVLPIHRFPSASEVSASIGEGDAGFLAIAPRGFSINSAERRPLSSGGSRYGGPDGAVALLHDVDWETRLSTQRKLDAG